MSSSHTSAHAVEVSGPGPEVQVLPTPLELHRLESAANRTLLDRIGAVLGFLCAIHCLAVPLLLGALPALGFLADHTFDLALIGVAAVVALFSARSGLKAHGDRRVAVGLVLAVGLLALGHLLGEDGLVGRIPSIIGGFA